MLRLLVGGGVYTKCICLLCVSLMFIRKLDLWIENSYNKIAGMIFIVQDNRKTCGMDAKQGWEREMVINKNPSRFN